MDDQMTWQDQVALDNWPFLWACSVISISFYLSCQFFFNFDRVLRKAGLFLVLICVGLYRGDLIFETNFQRDSLLVYIITSIDTLMKHHWLSYAAQDVFAIYILMRFVQGVLTTYGALNSMTKKQVINVVGGYALDVIRMFSFTSKMVEEELNGVEESVNAMFQHDAFNDVEKYYRMPTKAMDDDALIQLMTDLAKGEDDKWKDGYVSGAVYSGEDDHLAVMNKAYELFSVSNPLHPDVWPSVRKFEAEVISMTASLLNGGNRSVCGTMASGGTESIILATKTHRDWFRAEHGITKPNIIAAVTAHAAIDKACDLLGIKLIKVAVDPVTFKVDVNTVRRKIDGNTIMMYASAPNFPQGTIDDIEELSVVAQKFNVGLHVDCCLGGFVLPFAVQIGYNLPKFDFELPGVTSMSCDTHKYGYASKGTSIVLYRDANIRRYQYFCFPDWTGGLYATPSLPGSRPGALIAACWASMIRLGQAGYIGHTHDIMKTAKAIKEGINRMENLHVLGDPQAMVVSFGSKTLNVLRLSDLMSKKGWSLNALQHPVSVHICVTIRHVGKAQRFLNDLEDVTTTLLQLSPEERKDDKAVSAIYGMAATLPAGPVEDILRAYTDASLKV